MISKKLFSLATLLIINNIFSQGTLIRSPKISPDGTYMAFGYHGDIWVHNFLNKESRRLTIHQAYESNPVWSPNGKEIAFSSNRKGNENVFTISLSGGNLKQLTYYPTKNIPSCWNNSNIIFSTNRTYNGPEREKQMYEVNKKGGTPKRLLTAYGSMAATSPNAKLIAYVKGECRISREDYQGAAQKDIWIYNKGNNQYHRITTSKKNDHSPVWDESGNLYYISAKSGRYNIYKQVISEEGQKVGEPVQLTYQKIDGIRSFSVSNKGVILYMSGIDLYKLEKGTTTKISLNIKSDNHFNESEIKNVTNGINHYEISPNRKQIALEVGGEIFVKENDKKKKYTNNISNHTYKDIKPQWINDTTLFFISDRGGKFEIYSATSKHTSVDLCRSIKIDIKKELSEKADITNIAVSPNKKKIAYETSEGAFFIANLSGGEIKNKKMFSNSWGGVQGVNWSPDSRYVVYSQQDLDFDSEVFIQSAVDKNIKMNVSMHPRSDTSPVWSSDGKKIAFISNRNGMNNDVWMVWLEKEEWEKTKFDHENGQYYESKSNQVNKENEKKKKQAITVKIDKERIYERLVQVTSLSGNEYEAVFSDNNEFIYFFAQQSATNKGGIYKIKWDGSNLKEINNLGEIASLGTLEEKHIYFRASGKLKKLSIKSDSIITLSYIANYTVNHSKQRKQIFEEGVRSLTSRFYDPEFHGYNWDTIVKKYKPWVLSATTQQDFTDMFNVMLGQLNASHMGYIWRPENNVKSENIGLLGIEVSHVKEGVRVDYILSNSAADKSKSKLNIGDIIVAVNGHKIGQETNFYSLLRNAKGREVLVTLDNSKEIVIRTQSSLKKNKYEAWVSSRKKLVDEYSKGQLGYIHIQGMNMQSFERFERELKASGYGKKGIVIDVRYNGGGWTTDRLMAVLNVKQHAYTIPRGATKSLKNHKQFASNYPFNERAILSVNTKPSVALCNENSYSNAEIFSHAYKNLGIGKLVGQPTFGAVISTSGTPLQKGYIRMPFRAWFVKKTGKNMENEAPATPDYLVENLPGWKSSGEDAQLKKAVEVLLQDIK